MARLKSLKRRPRLKSLKTTKRRKKKRLFPGVLSVVVVHVVDVIESIVEWQRGSKNTTAGQHQQADLRTQRPTPNASQATFETYQGNRHFGTDRRQSTFRHRTNRGGNHRSD